MWWGEKDRRLCLVASAPQGEQTRKSLRIRIPGPGASLLPILMIRITVFRAGGDPSEDIEFTSLRGHCD